MMWYSACGWPERSRSKYPRNLRWAGGNSGGGRMTERGQRETRAPAHDAAL